MSYSITEQGNGLVQFDAPGGIAHAWRFLGDVTVHGRLAARPAAYSPAPTATNGIAASNATVNPLLVGSDFGGTIVTGLSANAVAGAEVCLSFGKPYASPGPYVYVTAANASTAAANCFVTASTNSFTIFTGVIPAASGTLAWNYLVISP